MMKAFNQTKEIEIFHNSDLIEKKQWIYVVLLESNKFYVGFSKIIMGRLTTYFLKHDGDQPLFTNKYKPKKLIIVISVEDIKKSSFAKGRAIREALTNLADRLSHQLAGEDDATVIHQIINSEHKEALNNLAQL